MKPQPEDSISPQVKEYQDYLTKATKEAGLSFFCMSAGFILGFFFNIIYARLLGADLLGVFVLGWTVVFFVSMLTNFGMNSTLPRFVSMHYVKGDIAHTRGVFIFSLKLTAVLSIVGLVGVVLLRHLISISLFKDERLVTVLLLLSFSLVPLNLLNISAFTLRGLKQPGAGLFCSEIVQRVARVIIFLGLVYTILYTMELRLHGFVVATLLAAFIASGIALLILSKKAPFFFRDLRNIPYQAKEILSYSAMMLLAGFMSYIMHHIDRFMLGYFLPSASVGIYNIAAQVALLCSFVLLSFNAIFSPIISDLYHRDKLSTLSQLFTSLTRWIIILTAPLFLWLILFGQKVLSVFGLEFVAGYSVLIALCIAQMVNSGVGSTGLLLAMTGHQKYNLINTTSMAIINIILNLMLIPRLGILGAGIATAVAIALINILQLIEVKLILNLFPYNLTYLKIVINFLVVWLALVLLKRFLIGTAPSLVSTIISLLFCYTISLVGIFILGLEEEDSFILRTILIRLGLIKGGV